MAYKSTREYEYADVTVLIAGKVITGLRGVKWGRKQEKELLHAKGNLPHSIQRGNITFDGEITLLESEYEALKAAGDGDILDVSFDMVIAVGNPAKGEAMKSTTIFGAEFTEDISEWKQGDKFQEKRLPFIYLREE